MAVDIVYFDWDLEIEEYDELLEFKFEVTVRLEGDDFEGWTIEDIWITGGLDVRANEEMILNTLWNPPELNRLRRYAVEQMEEDF